MDVFLSLHSENRSTLFLPIQFLTVYMCACPIFADLLSRPASLTVHPAAGPGSFISPVAFCPEEHTHTHTRFSDSQFLELPPPAPRLALRPRHPLTAKSSLRYSLAITDCHAHPHSLYLPAPRIYGPSDPRSPLSGCHMDLRAHACTQNRDPVIQEPCF